MALNSIVKLAVGIFACLLLTSALTQGQSATTGAQIHWSQLTDAQLKLDSKPPLAWGVYQPDKKTKKKGTDLLLVLVGHRYMMLDVKARLAYVVFPEDLHAHGNDFESDDLAKASN